MKLGIFGRSFARPSLGETLDAVAGYGIPHVQLNLASASIESIPSSLTEAQCEAIRREFERRGLIHAVLSGTFNIIHPDQAVRRRGFRGLALLARSAKRLGTDILSVSTGTCDPEDMWHTHPGNDGAASWREMLGSMERVAAIAEEHQVTVAFEPEQANIVNSAKKARALLDELQSGNVKVLIDAANLLTVSNLDQQDSVLQEAFQLLGGDIVVAHAKEFSADGRLGRVALGRGAVHFPLYVSLLEGIGYQGALIMHGFPEEAVRESRDHLLHCFSKLAL